MSLFNWGKEAEGIGNGIGTAAESIRFALTGDMPPEERIKLEALYIEAQKLEVSLREHQINLTMIDAKSTSFFKSGWRPLLGWVAVSGFSLVFVVFPIVSWIVNLIVAFNGIQFTPAQLKAINPPEIDGWLLMNLLGAMLGLGTLRTIEKGKGITK